MTVFGPTPVVVGHRGAGVVTVSGVPENTLASCLAAHDAGARWVELDARLTADGALVLFHDGHLPDGTAVDESTLEQCRAQGVETFDEVVGALPDGVGIDVDVKVALADARAPAPDTTAGRVAARAAELVGVRPVVLTSFDAGALLAAREVAPVVPCGLLGLPVAPVRELVAGAGRLRARVLAPHVVSLGVERAGAYPVDSQERIREALDLAHELGMETLAWGVAPSHVGPLVELGVSALCVDQPAAAVQALGGGATGRV